MTRAAVAIADAAARLIADAVAETFQRVDYLPADTVKVLAGEASRTAVRQLQAAGWHITAGVLPIEPEEGP